MKEIEKPGKGTEWIEAPDGKGGLMPLDPAMHIMGKLIVGRQATGAILNGRRVKKIKAKKSDRNPDGTLGTVKGSIGDSRQPFQIEDEFIHFGYIVDWDSEPGQLVFVTDVRIEEA